MPHSTKTVTAEPHLAEYSVYVYHPQDQEPKQAWEKTKTTNNPVRAMAEAEKLHASRKYPKVEIKKKHFDSVTHEATDIIYKVYQEQRNDLKAAREIGMLVVMFLVSIGCMAYYIIHISN